jgi:hypothetical protein
MSWVRIGATVAVCAYQPLTTVAEIMPRLNLLIEVDKPIQHMTVTVSGEQLYDWAVSTGEPGMTPRTAPSGHSA